MLRVTQLSGFGIGTSGVTTTNKILAAGVGSYSLAGTAASITPSGGGGAIITEDATEWLTEDGADNIVVEG